MFMFKWCAVVDVCAGLKYSFMKSLKAPSKNATHSIHGIVDHSMLLVDQGRPNVGEGCLGLGGQPPADGFYFMPSIAGVGQSHFGVNVGRGHPVPRRTGALPPRAGAGHHWHTPLVLCPVVRVIILIRGGDRCREGQGL